MACVNYDYPFYVGIVPEISKTTALEYSNTMRSAGISMAKLAKGDTYFISYEDPSRVVYFSIHFLKELRRQLSGDALYSNFNLEEENLYETFQEAELGTPMFGDMELVTRALDEWLITELTNGEHHEIQFSDTKSCTCAPINFEERRIDG